MEPNQNQVQQALSVLKSIGAITILKDHLPEGFAIHQDDDDVNRVYWTFANDESPDSYEDSSEALGEFIGTLLGQIEDKDIEIEDLKAEIRRLTNQ